MQSISSLQQQGASIRVHYAASILSLKQWPAARVEDWTGQQCLSVALIFPSIRLHVSTPVCPHSCNDQQGGATGQYTLIVSFQGRRRWKHRLYRLPPVIKVMQLMQGSLCFMYFFFVLQFTRKRLNSNIWNLWRGVGKATAAVLPCSMIQQSHRGVVLLLLFLLSIDLNVALHVRLPLGKRRVKRAFSKSKDLLLGRATACFLLLFPFFVFWVTFCSNYWQCLGEGDAQPLNCYYCIYKCCFISSV